MIIVVLAAGKYFIEMIIRYLYINLLSNITGIAFTLSQYLKDTKRNGAMLWSGLGLSCSLLIVIIIMTCYRNSIKLAIKLVKEGSK